MLYIYFQVRTMLKKHYNNHIAMREENATHRKSLILVGVGIKTMTSVTNIMNRYGSFSDNDLG